MIIIIIIIIVIIPLEVLRLLMQVVNRLVFFRNLCLNLNNLNLFSFFLICLFILSLCMFMLLFCN
jgi:hypothetical protein